MPASATFAKRELENVRDDVYLKDPRPLSGYDYFPQRGGIPSYKKFHIIRQYEMVGASQWFAEMGDDWPRADVVLDEDQFSLRRHGCAYGYEDDELEAAENEGRDLRRKRGVAARRAIRERNNHCMFFGDTGVKVFGAINYPGTPRVHLSDPIDSSTSADVIIQMVTDFIDTIDEVNESTVEPDVIGLPTAIYNHLRKRYRSSIDQTLLNAIRDVYKGEDDAPELRFVKMPELSGAGPDDEDVLYAFVDDEDSWGHLLPREFTQEEPEKNFPNWLVKCHSKTGGTAFDFPLHAAIGIVPKS